MEIFLLLIAGSGLFHPSSSVIDTQLAHRHRNSDRPLLWSGILVARKKAYKLQKKSLLAHSIENPWVSVFQVSYIQYSIPPTELFFCVNQIFRQNLVPLQRCHQKMPAYILTIYVTPEE